MTETTTDITVYIDQDTGADNPSQTGTEQSPFKTLQYAYSQLPAASLYLTRKREDNQPVEWKPVAKSALKKVVNYHEQQKRKAAKATDIEVIRRQAEQDREKTLEEAKKITLVLDKTLPDPVRIKLSQKDRTVLKLRKSLESEPGTRVRVIGRVHRERKQKDVLFITIRDGHDYLQCVLTGILIKAHDALTLTRETTMELYGELWEVPPGFHAPDDRELRVDYYKIQASWKAVGGDNAITNRVQAGGDPKTLLDLRHLTLRGETASAILVVRSIVESAFHQAYKELGLLKVTPPSLVQTQVEGGATLFKFDYYGETAFLTQSSQLYLETCLPTLGDVYCVEKSFRAEKSLTRRHLSEYTHVEAELDFITFEDLLVHLESILCRVLELTFEDPIADRHLKQLNPDFKMPERPFLRMKYSEAIEWLIKHEIPNESGKPHKIGDDIAEAAERRVTDLIGRPIFLTHFPTEIKAFYMQPDPDDPSVTESVDCLMPGVGEIVGGSMRMYDYDRLMAAYERVQIDPAPYYWYTDQRRYGSSPHGGYGLGLERFLAWLCNQHTVRDCCLYPRYMGRCTP